MCMRSRCLSPLGRRRNRAIEIRLRHEDAPAAVAEHDARAVRPLPEGFSGGLVEIASSGLGVQPRAGELIAAEHAVRVALRLLRWRRRRLEAALGAHAD